MCLNLVALAICAEFYRNEQYTKLKKENEKLEFDIFLLKNNNTYLLKLFSKYNMKKVFCACYNCLSNDIYDANFEDERYNNIEGEIYEHDPNFDNFELDECKFMDKIKTELQNFGITYQHDKDTEHLLIDTDWGNIKYGKKLTEANSLYDMEIQKFQEFINYLENL